MKIQNCKNKHKLKATFNTNKSKRVGSLKAYLKMNKIKYKVINRARISSPKK